MNDYVEAQINKLHRELERDVISLVKQLLGRISGETEEIVERLCLLSGISKERLKEIRLYTSRPEVSYEWVEDSDGVRYERECEVEKESINLTIQELHSLCNVIRLSASSIPSMGNGSAMEEIIEKSGSIIERWIERVNYYYNCSNILFGKLVKKSNTKSSEEFLATYHIFIDTSALCDENTKDILEILIPEMKNVPKPLKITIPKAVVDCLQDVKKEDERNYIFGADEGLCNLKKIQEADLLSVRGDDADTTVMSTFLSAFSRFKPVYKMMLITQDETLANAVKMLNTSGIEGDEILICKAAESTIVDFWFDSEPEKFEDGSTAESKEIVFEKSSQEDAVISDDEDALNDVWKEAIVFGIAPVEESVFDEEIPTDTDDEALKTVSSFQLEESEIDSRNDNSVDDEIETDIEKMSMLEEQLANMLGRNTKHTEDSDDDELSDDDDFDTEEDSKKDINYDIAEEELLMEDAFDSDSWSVLD